MLIRPFPEFQGKSDIKTPYTLKKLSQNVVRITLDCRRHIAIVITNEEFIRRGSIPINIFGLVWDCGTLPGLLHLQSIAETNVVN
jgi:hypothetical protein